MPAQGNAHAPPWRHDYHKRIKPELGKKRKGTSGNPREKQAVNPKVYKKRKVLSAVSIFDAALTIRTAGYESR